MSAPVSEMADNNLRVLFDFEYKTKDDRKISIKEGEKLFLIKKTNPDWWQVIRSSKERPFYVPATYVEEATIGNGNINQVKSNAQSTEQKLRNKLDRESNGNLLSKYPSRDYYYQQQSRIHENAHSEKIDGTKKESVPFFIKHTEDSPEAKRILFDKRKSWAVEELMLELTQKHDIRTGPEPEPEPDYANIYRDEHGIHIISGTENSHATGRPKPNVKPNKSTLPSSLNGNSTKNNTSSKESLSSGNDRKDTGNQFFLSKQGLSGVQGRDNDVSLQNVTGSSSVTSPDSVSRDSNIPTCSLSVKENGGFLLSQDILKGSSKDLKISTKPVSVNVRSSIKFNNDDSRISVVSVDGANPGSVSESSQGSGYSTVSIAQNNDTEGRYSKVSIVKKDSLKSSVSDLCSDDAQPFTRDSDVVGSQRLIKGPKIKQLSESLEKLAQQIQFGPAVTSEASPPSWRKKQSRSFEEESQNVKRTHSLEEKETTDFDLNNVEHNNGLNTDEKLQTYPNKMLKKVKNKLGLQYSSSFKTKKELEMNRKVHHLETEVVDQRASVSGNVSIDPDFAGVAFHSGKREDEATVGEVTHKDALPIPQLTFNEIHQELQHISELPRDSLQDLPLNSFGKTAQVSSPNHRSPKDNLAIIGEATILLDDSDTRFPFGSDADPKAFPSKENLTKIALGFQNPSYRSMSHSLDSFHDPKVVHAMHEALCTDLDEQQKLKKEKKSTESLQGSGIVAEKSSKWKVARQAHEGKGLSESKMRNFQMLRNSIEENEFSGGREISVLSGKQVNVTSDNKNAMRKESVPGLANVSSRSEKSKMKVGSVEDVKLIDKAFEGIYDGLGELKTSRSSSKASLDGDKVLREYSSKSSLDELVSSFENRSLSKSNLSLNQRKPSNGSEGNRSRSDSNTSDDTILQAPETRRRTSLSRGTRVESIKERHQLKLPARPPSPPPSQQPVRVLHDGWGEYQTQDGRTFYYSHAGGKSWKPPRKNKFSVSRDSEESADGPKLAPEFQLPPGWRESFEDGCDSELRCFVHQSGARWFSSNNEEQKIYFFEENSNESSWTLPDIPSTPDVDAKPVDLSAAAVVKPKTVAKLTRQMGAEQEEAILRGHRSNQPFRLTKAMSMVVVPTMPDDKSPVSAPHNWPYLFEGNMKFLREGPLHRTKLTEHGKKVRKNWSSSYVILSELLLLFFHDIKHVQALKNGEQSTSYHPEFTIDLAGAHIERGDKLSRRKNVFVISAQFGIQVLIQSDSSKTAEEWFHSIQTQIALLPGNCDSFPRTNTSPEETKKSSKLGRSKSVKLKRAEGSMEDLTATPEERQTKIRARLKKFFVRRPTKDALVKKGIYKDEPMFGRSLGDVAGPDSKGVPVFVVRCIAAIESKEENMKADGLYRVSGNLSQVQKIRLQADQNNLASLEEEEDVHVLTGALKLFFRELKQPLIPTELFSKALKASSNPDKKEKARQFRDIVKALPSTNRETLKYILLHLLRVAEHKESNRMHLANLAIVFGPTLMWPEEESLNMAIDLMQQNLVIECLLLDYHTIFR